MVITAHESHAPGRRRRHQLQPLRRAGNAREPDARDPEDAGAVRAAASECGTRRLRAWHPESDVRIAGLGEQPGLHGDVARIAVLRHRRAQHEVRLSGCLSPREPELLRQRHAPDVPAEPRRAQPAHDGSETIQDRTAHSLGGALCPGAMDARPHDAAGRDSLRPRVELFPRSTDRTGDIPADAAVLRGTAGRDRLQRHHAARRDGLRRLRQRQDVAEGERRQVSRGRHESQHVFADQPGRTTGR